MARIQPIDMDQAQGKAAELLDEVVAHGGDPGPMATSRLPRSRASWDSSC